MTKNPKIKKAIRVTTIATLVVTILLALDITPVALATFQLRESEGFSVAGTALVADFDGIRKCNDMTGEDGRYKPAWRECYLSNVPQAKSVKGAYVQAVNVHRWLEENAGDEVVREKALKAVDAGWAALKADEPVYELHEKFEKAANRSLLLALVNGGRDHYSMRDIDQRLLEQAEMAIGAPELFKKQALRKADLAMARTELSATSK